MKKSVISAGASSEMSGASRWLAASTGGEAGASARTDSPRSALLRVRDKRVVRQGFPASTGCLLVRRGAREGLAHMPCTGIAASWMQPPFFEERLLHPRGRDART